MADLQKYYTRMVALLAAKYLALNLTIILARLRENRFASPEDRVFKMLLIPGMLGPAPFSIDANHAQSLSMVDRLRAALRNDMENLPWFAILTPLYLAAKPRPETAQILMRVFCVSRFVHTLSYVVGAQPFRFLGFAGGFGSLAAMTGHLLTVTASE